MTTGEDLQRQETAAGWVLQLRSPELTEAVAAEWLEWIEEDARNRQAFDAMTELWRVAGGLDARELALAPPSPANDEGRRSKVWLGAVAAVLLALLAGALTLPMRPFAPSKEVDRVVRLETPVGRVQATTLEDGSKVELGGRSSLSIRYSPDRRLVVANEGEAFFSVASNPDQPFVVQAGPVTITAVGTAFSVQRDGDSVAVTVTEGVVEVSTTPSPRDDGVAAGPIVLRASAGHRIRFDRGELTRSVEPVEADIVEPWREGRLEFRDEPLRLVVARINRYSRKQIEISDLAIADLRLTTTVYDDRVDEWLHGLAMVLPVRVASRGEDRAVISPATGSGPAEAGNQ